jgi:hypothetical protein
MSPELLERIGVELALMFDHLPADDPLREAPLGELFPDSDGVAAGLPLRLVWGRFGRYYERGPDGVAVGVVQEDGDGFAGSIYRRGEAVRSFTVLT